MPRWFYAVKDPAHVRGVYNDWPTCERKVRGVSGANFKKFRSMGEAENYIESGIRSSFRRAPSRSRSRSRSRSAERGSSSRGPYSLYYDGASRGNPGPAGGGAHLLDPDTREIWNGGKYLDRTTNNVAEYQGMILGMEEAARRGVQNLHVYGDSELIARQMRGEYRVSAPHLVGLYNRARALERQFPEFHISNIPRAENSRADQLANEAVDKRCDFSST